MCSSHVLVKYVLSTMLMFTCTCGVMTEPFVFQDEFLPTGNLTGEEFDVMLELMKGLRAENLEDNLRYFTKEPHSVGTPRNNELGEEIARRWRSYNFTDVTMPQYDVLIKMPVKEKPSKVSVVDEEGRELHMFPQNEKPLTEEERKYASEVFPSFLSGTRPGVVIGDVVYANYGTDEDFAELKRQGVQVKGKIALMRMGRGFRGNKINCAEEQGCLGALVYTDPKNFAPEGPNNTFPNSWWLPETGVQRGGAGLGYGPGDIRTPGYPSKNGTYRRPLGNNTKGIPGYELSYKDALYIFQHMKGPDAPRKWHGKLPVRYKLGPGFENNNTYIRLEVRWKPVTVPIYDVIGTIRGREEPDRYVMLGNHRDAWTFGAGDPSSGTAILMELSRGLGELLKTGWRPRRTIMLCSWDSEERGVMGSTEWVEEHAEILHNRAVVYLNIDNGVSGNFSLNMDSSPLLEELLVATAKEIADPTTNQSSTDSSLISMYDIVLKRDARRKVDKGEPICESLAFGSDYVPFHHLIGVTCGDWAYIFGGRFRIRRSYPVYHSMHDNFEWMKKFVDPDFKIHLAVTNYTVRVLMKIAEAEILPFNTTNYAVLLNQELRNLKRESSKVLQDNEVNIEFLSNAIQEFFQAATQFDKFVENRSNIVTGLEKRAINDQLMLLERMFIDKITPRDHPFQDPFRNVVYGPDRNNIYRGVYFPQVKSAIKMAKITGKWENVKKAISVLIFSIRSATELLKPVI